MMAGVAAITSAVVGLVGAGVSAQQQYAARQDQKRAEKKQRKAERIQQRQAEIQNARERRRAIARQRSIRASALASAEGAGVSGSSAIQGAIGSLDTQLASNVSFQNQMMAHEQDRFNAITRRNDFINASNQHISNASTAQAIGSAPEQLGFGSTGQNLAKVFGYNNA